MINRIAVDLRNAAAVLERDGWTQGVFEDAKTGCRCAVGAIRFASNGSSMRITKRSLAALSLLEARVGRVPEWNDAERRTAQQVIAEIRAAADTAEAAR